MRKPLKQDSHRYASTFAANNLVRKALEELVNALDLHQLGPKHSRPGSRKFRISKPFLPPGSSSKLTHERPNQSQASKPACSYSSTALSECREDLDLPVWTTTTISPAIVDGKLNIDSSHINSCFAGSARRTIVDMEKLQSRLVIPSLWNAKEHCLEKKKTSGGNSIQILNVAEIFLARLIRQQQVGRVLTLFGPGFLNEVAQVPWDSL